MIKYNDLKHKKIYFFIIIIISAIIISLEIYSISTYKIKEEVMNNKEEITIHNNTIQNEIEDQLIEQNELQEENLLQNKVQDKEKTEKETSKKENKTRKTPSGKKYTSIGSINIPSLNIKYEILSDTSDELLKISINKYWGADPNKVGNMCLVGHNYKNSRFFGNLPKIKKGAKVYITDLDGKTLTYKVYETDIISENDLSCTTQKTNGNIEITLITCYYMPGDKHASKRFIAKARVE